MPGPGMPLEFGAVAIPEPEPGAMLLETLYSEVCGTDVHLWHGRLAGVPYPIIPGHVSVGRVAHTDGSACDLEGQPFRARLKELPARVVQHETDHVDGVVFLDRLEDSLRRELQPKIAEFEVAYQKRQAAGEIPDDETLRKELERLAQSGTVSPE